MVERTGPPIVFDDFVALAIEAANESTCQSQRGAVAFSGRENETRELVAVGFNQQPSSE